MAPHKAPVQPADSSSAREEWNKQKELTALKRVFAMIDSDRDGVIREKELNAALLSIGYKAKRGEVADMIWEVDENCDGLVTWEEFIGMFHRCKRDQTGLEPHKLFQVVEFMMHDVDNSGSISQDELMEILFARFGKDQLLEKTGELFPTPGGAEGSEGEREITFVDFRRFMQAIKPKRKTNREKALAINRPPGFRSK
mmetsp:Transcript_2743/g.8060  ORF Transcript_2743/g.8060 Transcript_2743/m.8060 type:complete len:198 (+) Transcript_2743:63-656(+)|eukprot:CAMPEP_0206046294 /NCGR_PEP_ID=MMETSP1466-20131121/18258_1 /ASSEMBLY_ACC=CAM_ASM_001126 /TAXON_ID=44452 /ORGANISM="Pavlova gyrans, Strain CCMP608" /LENGTH=197 /DNA_ID=CAMNT_0053421269 /DNA_START=5 /DNA_END=598 /DNA_ORIENTATION=+